VRSWIFDQEYIVAGFSLTERGNFLRIILQSLRQISNVLPKNSKSFPNIRNQPKKYDFVFMEKEICHFWKVFRIFEICGLQKLKTIMIHFLFESI